jgi:hypothetical protein
MKKKFIQIMGWYINLQRIIQLLNNEQLSVLTKSLKDVNGIDSPDSQLAITRSLAKKELEKWLHINKVETLEKLVVDNKLEKGCLFTHYSDFYGRGLSKYYKFIPKNAVALIYSKLKISSGYKTIIKYSPNNLVSNSSWGRLSGHSRLFVFGYIEDIEGKIISARPYIIGDIYNDINNLVDNWNYNNYGELHITNIDSFSKVIDFLEKETQSLNLQELKNISEEYIKKSFAEIIHEGSVPKDWGGEKSDLFSNNVIINRKKVSSAFMFKGPAKFHKMKISDLGKNGDQIDRLFSEPAELMVLQHSHEVSSEVRNMMRAYAERIFNLKHFIIIDGYDTLRILKAYNKI